MGRLLDWIDDRTAYRQLLGAALGDTVPGGARLRYVFGWVLLYLFVQQAVLGVLLAFYYSPSASDAWASTAFLNDQITGGWFIRGLHYHGTSLMIVVMGGSVGFIIFSVMQPIMMLNELAGQQ